MGNQVWKILGPSGFCVVLMVGATSLALNIWNMVRCSKGLSLAQGCPHDMVHLQAFLIGSIVCSAIATLSCGITIPVPQLVFAILGQAWGLNAAAMGLCGPDLSAKPSLLSSIVHQSIIVLWFTFAANLCLIVFLFYLPFCIMAAVDDDD